ncbi:hypothetical protein OC25_13550 [Pedobacter kyungheensis]|uniref:Uncharacterized protein n=2 Tax=Pedobacter TaxID=84567 RepID=A0A1G6VNX9_9SPHI|nr:MULTISPECIES: hypothetical protein [Pedobacter]KIA93444.1 hypothetical protein OC25_13550 [Pedobacter kyungheensis]SDD55360.1 hypothetical protein SAMN04488024_106207 [Pedobacter soli]
MKIKTLKDLEDNFEVLSHSEEKQTLGGVNMISAYDGNIYDVVMPNMGYTTGVFVDTDSSWGGSFSYHLDDDGYGSPVTINVNETDYGMGTSSWDRFTLLYVGMDFDSNASSEKVYYDNLTGYTFSTNSLYRETNGGYNYESLPDLIVSDNDMGSFSGYTIFQIQLQEYVVLDELTGAYQDFSQIISTSTHYDADYVGMMAAGYQQQAIDAQIARDNASRADGNFISSLMNNLNGSKLAAAKSAWAADPNNYGQDFNYGTYNQNTMATPVLNVGSSAYALKDSYGYIKEQLAAMGLNYTINLVVNWFG